MSANGGRPGGIGIPHGLKCTCSLCMPALTVGGAVVHPYPMSVDSDVFIEAMAEVQTLRMARAVTLWKLFKLALCQQFIVELRMRDLERRAARADGLAFLKPQAE